MPKRTVLETIIVFRDGKRVEIKPEKPAKAFEFTAEEITQINASNPGAFRKPINESGAQETDKVEPEAGKPAGSVPVPAANTSGVNSASGAATLANANKPAGDKPATTASDKPAVEL